MQYKHWTLKPTQTIFFLLLLLITLPGAASVPLKAEDICHVQESHRAGMTCKNGDIMLYIPANPMNASKTAVVLTALVCDFNHHVEREDESLTCIFTDARKAQWSMFGMDVQ